MANVERSGVIPPLPNSSWQNGDPGSSGPMGRSASSIHVPGNAEFSTAHPNNSYLPLGHQASPVKGSNAEFKFSVENARMPQPPSAIQPGHGAIPVSPFGGPNGMTPLARIPEKPMIPKGK